MRTCHWISVAALVGVLAALSLNLPSAAAEGRATRSDIMSVSELRAGMKGYGLTVFQGTEPTKFDVEIIDVLYNFRPHQDLILVKTDHPRLEAAKVVAGMSGSPVYINGKMIGAYAYGWSFGAEPVAGVTPIRSMLDDLARPLPEFIHGWPIFGKRSGKTGRRASLAAAKGQARRYAKGVRLRDSPTRYRGKPGSYDLDAHRAQLARSRGGSPSLSGLQPVSTPLLMGGLTPGGLKIAEDMLSPFGLVPMQAGGSANPDPAAPKRYVDGGAVGVQLVRGDISAMGLGTVTRVEGDRLLGFGHPMMNGGVTALPAAIGKVLWVLASQNRSFKIGMSARPVGALVNDRQASIVVSHSAKAPTVPVTMRVEGSPGAPHTDWRFDVAHEKFLSGSLLSMALGNGLQAAAAEKQDVSWILRSKVKVRGIGELELEDFGVAVGGTPDQRVISRSNLVDAVGAIMNNPWEPAFIEGIDVQVGLKQSRDIYRLRGAEVLTPVVAPGGSARIRLELWPFAGKPVFKTLSMPIARHHAGRTLKIQVRPGYLVEKNRPEPESLAQLVQAMEDPVYEPRSVVLSYAAGAGVAFRGHLAENLPARALDALAHRSSSVRPQKVQSHERRVFKLKNFLIGKKDVVVKVKSVVESN